MRLTEALSLTPHQFKTDMDKEEKKARDRQSAEDEARKAFIKRRDDTDAIQKRQGKKPLKEKDPGV